MSMTGKLVATEKALKECKYLVPMFVHMKTMAGSYTLQSLGVAPSKNAEILWLLWMRCQRAYEQTGAEAAEFVAELVVKMSRSFRIDGMARYIEDLIAYDHGFKYAVNELRWIARHADLIGEVQAVARHLLVDYYVKGADVVLKSGRQIELKFYTWSSPFYLGVSNCQRSAEKVVRQLRSRVPVNATPNVEVRFGQLADMPAAFKEALEQELKKAFGEGAKFDDFVKDLEASVDGI
jgi:hypothetical protein